MITQAFDMRAFSAENLQRCTSEDGFNHPLASWSLSDWMTATLGELGEAANVLKKLNRVRDGITGNTETADELRAMLADEIADAYIYMDLFAQAAGIDLPTAVRGKFDKTSQKIGYLRNDDDFKCFICGNAFRPDDLCASDINEGTCHAACIEGSPVVDLETGEPVDGPASTFRYGDDTSGSDEPRVFNIGNLSMAKVFKPAGLTNVHDLQAVFDAVEAALSSNGGEA